MPRYIQDRRTRQKTRTLIALLIAVTLVAIHLGSNKVIAKPVQYVPRDYNRAAVSA